MIGSVMGVVLSALAAGAGAIEWRSELTAAQEAARASGKPLFVVFRCER